MRKIYPFFIFCIIIFTSISCKKGGFLAPTVTTNLSQSTIFADSAYTEGFLVNIYANVGFSADAARFGNGGMDAACDEAEVANTQASTALSFATGTINGLVVTNGAYDICYENIRAVNILLKNLPKSPLKSFFKKQRRAEAHFLRAWYYAMLLKHYGGVAILGDSVYNYTDHIPVKRNTYEQCVNYILAECDSGANVLPVTQIDVNLGRASKGACLALKSRVLLYAASKLFNGTTLTDGPLKDVVGYPAADNNRWNLAAKAADDVLTLNAYALNTATGKPGLGFVTLFPKRLNSEYIFQLMRPKANDDLEILFDPPSRTGNGKGAFPYQQLVDAFTMRNGRPITDAASGFDPANPYANRDPRMEYTVIHDQSLLGTRVSTGGIQGYSPVNIFIGNYKGQTTSQDAVKIGTPTGYYTNKMLDTAAVANAIFATTSRCIPLMRYAEILLNYAEAVNEFYGPTGQLSSGVTPYDAVIALRKRAGILPGTDNLYGLDATMSKDQMRDIIYHERQVELAFEEQRFWDVRRWMIADQTENQQMYGMEVDRDGTNVVYNIFQVRKHNFHTAMYLWPLPQVEVSKSPELLQNPGY